MSKNVYYVNSSVAPYLNSPGQISDINNKIKKQTKTNASFDNVINNHTFLANGKSSRTNNLIGYYFLPVESQQSFMQSSINKTNIEKNKLHRINNENNFLPNVKKEKNQNINLNKNNEYPTNYGFYESKYSKKKDKICETEYTQPRKILSNISDNNASNLKQKINNNKSYKIPCSCKITTELNFYPSKNNENNEILHKNFNNQTSKKNSSQFNTQTRLVKKKFNKPYLNSDKECFNSINQFQVAIDLINNQSYNIIQKKKIKKKNKIVNTVPYQITETKTNDKSVLYIDESAKFSKSNDKIKIDNNYSQNYTNRNYSNFNLEQNNSHNYNYSNNIEKLNKSSIKKLNPDLNLNFKKIPFNHIIKAKPTPRDNITESFHKYKRNNRILINGAENFDYNNNTEPNTKRRNNRFEESPIENKNKNCIHIFDNGKNNSIQVNIKNTKKINAKQNNKQNNKQVNKIIIKKYKSTKIKPLEIVNINDNKKSNKNNKKISEKSKTINVTENNNKNKSPKILKTYQNNEPKTIEQKLTYSTYNNNSFEKQKNNISNNNLIKYKRLTLTNFKMNSIKIKKINLKRNITDFAKFEQLPKTINQKEDEWDQTQYVGLRKKTYDLKKRTNKNNNNSYSINTEFSSTNYIKECKAVSIPGKNEHGFKKTNQDTYLIEKNINGILNFNIFGVLDGHGIDGHFASQFMSRYFIYRIKNHPKIKILDEPNEIYYKLKENGYKIIANIFTDADLQIQKEKFEFYKSGTTCVIVIQLEEHLICANVGDSRAILVYDENYDDNLLNSKIYNLSYDCKPNLPLEKKRIYEYGGTVEKALDENNIESGPYRVWAKNENYPGLAMSRSIGDIDSKKFGVIPNPQIVEYVLNYYSKYMIICSDGIWEFIDNEKAMKIGNKYYLRNDPQGLCQELIQQAVNYWMKEDVVIDDITVVVVFF